MSDLVRFAVSGLPYGPIVEGVATGGPAYPPGTFAVLSALGKFPEMGAAWALIFITGAAVAVLAGPVMCAAFSKPKRCVAGAIGLATTLVMSSALDYYALVLIGVSSALLVVLATSLRWNSATLVIGTPLMLGTAFPIAFGIDRMNLDVVVFALLTLTVLMLKRGHNNWAAAAFGTAVAVKIYPFYLAVADFGHRRRVERLLIAAATGIAVTVIGILSTQYSFQEAKIGFDNSVAYFEQNYIVASTGMPYGASLLTAIKILYRERGHTDVNQFAASIYPLWKMWSPVALGLVAALTVFLRLPPWCRLMIIMSSLLVLSPNSGMYRASMVLIPVAMWLGHLALRGAHQRSTRLELTLAAFIGVGLAPLTYWEVMGFESTVNITSQSLLAPIAFTAILIASLLVGLQQLNVIFKPKRNHVEGSDSATPTEPDRAQHPVD